MEGRKQFTFYRSYFEALRRLPGQQRLGALEAVIGYALDGTEPDGLDDMQEMAFLLIKPTLDAARKMAAGGAKSKPKKRSAKGRAKEGEKEAEGENEIEKENEIEAENEDDSLWPEGFEEFWDLYPVKLGRDKALDAWKRLKPDPQEVCDGVRNWRQTKQWTKDRGRFIPRAAKFLEERHYCHLPAGHIPPGASGVLGKAELEAIERIMGG